MEHWSPVARSGASLGSLVQQLGKAGMPVCNAHTNHDAGNNTIPAAVGLCYRSRLHAAVVPVPLVVHLSPPHHAGIPLSVGSAAGPCEKYPKKLCQQQAHTQSTAKPPNGAGVVPVQEDRTVCLCVNAKSPTEEGVEH